MNGWWMAVLASCQLYKSIIIRLTWFVTETPFKKLNFWMNTKLVLTINTFRMINLVTIAAAWSLRLKLRCRINGRSSKVKLCKLWSLVTKRVGKCKNSRIIKIKTSLILEDKINYKTQTSSSYLWWRLYLVASMSNLHLFSHQINISLQFLKYLSQPCVQNKFIWIKMTLV